MGRGGAPHTLRGSMPGGDTALVAAMEVKELGSSPFTVLEVSTRTGAIISKQIEIQNSTKESVYYKRLTFCQSKWCVESERTWWRCC